MLIDSIFSALGSGLKLWSSVESRKYIDKYLKLRKDYYDETNKPESEQDFAVIDNIEFELKLLCDSFGSSVGAPEAKNPS